MAKSTTYVTKVTSFGHVRNRQKVDEAALEGRIIPPVVEYLPQGSQVNLEPEHGKALAEKGIVEEPGASQAAEKQRLEARIADLQRQQEQIDAQAADAEKQRKAAASTSSTT